MIVTKTCTCGAQFQLNVELAVHREKTGHPAVLDVVAPASSPLPIRKRGHWKLSAVAGLTLMGLLGFTAGFNLTVRAYTSWRGTANVLLIP